MVSRGGSSPLPCVILRDEYLFFLAALIKYGVNPEAPTTGNCFLAGGPQKSFARSSDSQTDYARPGCRITNPLSHRCHGGPRRAQITEWTTSELENVSTWGCHPSWCVCPYVGGILICPNPRRNSCGAPPSIVGWSFHLLVLYGRQLLRPAASLRCQHGINPSPNTLSLNSTSGKIGRQIRRLFPCMGMGVRLFARMVLSIESHCSNKLSINSTQQSTSYIIISAGATI